MTNNNKEMVKINFKQACDFLFNNLTPNKYNPNLGKDYLNNREYRYCNQNREFLKRFELSDGTYDFKIIRILENQRARLANLREERTANSYYQKVLEQNEQSLKHQGY